MPNVRMSITGGAAVAALAWLAGAGVASASTNPVAASPSPSPSATAAAASSQCPIAGSYGDGSTASAYQAYAAISPTAPPAASSSGQLAFTGANLSKEFAGGGLLIGAGVFLVVRSRRKPALAAEGLTEDDFPIS